MKPRRNQTHPKTASALSPGRKWLFRILVAILFPLLALGGLEAALRLTGYGHNYPLFKQLTIGGHEFLVNNDDFSRRFFPAEMARPLSSLRLEPVKPPDTFRIFILGESAAMGDPEPAFGAGRYLEVLLRERYPGQKFEVVNLGITAINSHVIVPIARECTQRQGDLWIVYMGNNEMVGPFGAATVFGAQAPPVAFVRLSLALQQTRVGQLLMAAGKKFQHPSANGRAWGGMQMFVENKVRPDDPRREVVYKNFQRNLADILHAGLDSGAHVLLSTVAVNLKDCPPFASLGATNDADGQFREAVSLSQAGNLVEARRHYQTACDLDALPFRADSRINTIISDTARQFSKNNLRLFDAAGSLASANSAGICGAETFYEHVHFNFDGNYRLARVWAVEIESWLPPSANTVNREWATQEICERRLGLTDWNRSGVIDSVISRMYSPPLSTQGGNAPRIAALRQQAAELRARMDDSSAAAARALYQEALQRAPDDFYLHENFAAFLAARKELPLAIEEWRRVHELMPQDFVADYQMGRLLAEEGKLPEAEAAILPALAAHPGFTEGWLKLGEIHGAESKLEPARTELERAKQLRPQDPEIYYQLGMVLSRLKLSAESLGSFREAVRLRPDYWEAHYTLGGELGMHDQVGEARNEFETVVRLNPQFAMGHLNLGVALLKQGHLDQARAELETTLQLEPENKMATAYLRQAGTLKRR